jgi:cold shock CspA family protein
MLAYQKGKLISWNDDRGFGFIEPENKAKKIFLHISALKKHGRRPREGDIIYYQLDMDTKNRIQASNAYIEGVQYQRAKKNQISHDENRGSRSKTPYKKRSSKASISHKRHYSILQVLVVVAIIIGSITYFGKYQKNSLRESSSNSLSPSSYLPSQSQQYQCEGKIRCSEMISCEEAKFYLQNCPGVEIDGDGDGIPCERQWCGN